MMRGVNSDEQRPASLVKHPHLARRRWRAPGDGLRIDLAPELFRRNATNVREHAMQVDRSILPGPYPHFIVLESPAVLVVAEVAHEAELNHELLGAPVA